MVPAHMPLVCRTRGLLLAEVTKVCLLWQQLQPEYHTAPGVNCKVNKTTWCAAAAVAAMLLCSWLCRSGKHSTS
jgi:hypothetical protein